MEAGKNRTLNTDERIDEVIVVFKTIIDALEDVKGNKSSLTKSCNDRGLNMLKVRGLMQTALNAAGKESVNISEISKLKNPYEELYKDIFGVSDEAYNKVVLPYDYKESIQWAMNKVLSDVEKDVIDKRYGLTSGEGETLSAIGDSMNRSTDRVRQIEACSLRKLRRHSCREVITLGLEAANLKAENERKLQELNLENINNEFKARLAEEEKRHAENLEDIKNGEFASTRKDICQNALISSFDMTVRSYNCLLRANIKNLYDLLMCEDISEIRNLGKRSAEEILSILEKFVGEHFNTSVSDLKVLLKEDEVTDCLKRGDYETLCKNTSIDYLYEEGIIETRYSNALKRGGIENLYQFFTTSEKELLCIRNLSKVAYYSVLGAVDKFTRNEFKKEVSELKELLK